MAAVTISAMTKVYPNGVKAIEDLDLGIEDGEFFALLGPSGCGKTTLLRLVAGLETASSGRIAIGGEDVTRRPPGARDVAMVFQDYALYPHMDVADNIAYPLKIKKVAKAARRQQAEETGAHLGLAEVMSRRPAQLSGGQQQRVALSRAVAFEPRVFLFDEPLSNLDARLRMEARTFLKRLHAELRTTTIYVTHDQSEALALADRMAVMDHGVVRQIGTPAEVFHRPANLFVAGFIGSTPMNLLSAVVAGGGLRIGDVAVPVPHGAAGRVRDGEDVVLAARPEYITLRRSPGGDALPCEVTITEDLGTSYLVTAELAGEALRVVVPEGECPEPGDRAWAAVDWSRALLYRQDGGDLIGADAPGVPGTGAASASDSAAPDSAVSDSFGAR